MLQNQKVLVAGLGGTGISVLAYCAHIGVAAAGYDAQLSETQRAELTEKFPQFPLFAGSLHTFNVALHTPSTPFQAAVWQGLQQIPYGKTASYREQAERLGRPTAVRAVANANGQNRVSIIIPCHRVIGADGSLTGYAGGLQRKAWLLQHEQGMQAAFGGLFD